MTENNSEPSIGQCTEHVYEIVSPSASASRNDTCGNGAPKRGPDDSPTEAGPAARAYTTHGWAIIEFAKGAKGPRYAGWNKAQSATRDPAEARLFTGNLGLCHAYSRTCCLDLDDLAVARDWLKQRDIQLDELLADPGRVGISSGRPNRAKLLYRLPDGIAPLPSKCPADSGLELRCATANGMTVQDVLPPSIHPVTLQPYRWGYGDALNGHWSVLPVLPDNLLALWRSLLTPELSPADRPAPKGIAADRLRGMLARIDPDVEYNEWVTVGMALHHEAEGEDWALDLWDEWSARGTKYKDPSDLEPHWRSFGSNRGRPVTIRRLIAMSGRVSPDDFEDLTRSESADTNSVPASGQRLRAMPWDEFMQGPEPEYLIENLIGKGSLSMVYGESTAGKTYLAVALAVAVAAGKQWTGRDVEGGNVIYVANEGVPGLRLRMRAAMAVQGVSEDTVQRQLSFITDVPSLQSDLDVGRVIEEALLVNAKLIVIDTLSHSIAGADENAAEAMSAVISRCMKIVIKTGATVLLVHHAGKEAHRGARGSTVLKAAVDNELSVELTKDDAVRRVRVTKMKDGDGAGVEFNMTFARVDLGISPNGKPRHSAGISLEAVGGFGNQSSNVRPPKRGTNQRLVLAAVETFTGLANTPVPLADVISECLQKKVAPQAGIRDQRAAHIVRAIEDLLADGLLEKEGESVRLPSMECRASNASRSLHEGQ